MYLLTLFNIISLTALAVIRGISAQDDGPGFVTKCAQPGHVALTFDDGPSPFTPKLLEYLDTAKVPATFFVLGVSINQDGGKQTLKTVFDAGHQIALHSNTHADMNAKSPDEILSEYTINLKAVQDTIGVSPAMARPPFGNCNSACAKVLEGQMNLTVIQWNCDSNDWQYEGQVANQPKLFTNMKTIIDGSNLVTDSFITLQHDIKDYSVEYVPKVIDMIKAKGYTFVTVEQCIDQPAYVGRTVQALAAAPPAAPPSTPSYVPDATPSYALDTTPSGTTSAVTSSSTQIASSGINSVANANSVSSVTNSADKFTLTYGLNLICLIFGLLVY